MQSVVKLYCEGLDRFVSIRECSEREIASLTKDLTNVSCKRDYCDLVTAFCIVEYFPGIAELLNGDFSAIADIVKEELYALCTKINPTLEIKKVRVVASEKQNHILLIGTGEQIGISNVENLQIELARNVLGQDEAIDTITKCIKRAAVGLKDPKKPVSSFTFVGRTGVGKTEMAKAIQKCLYGDDEPIRVDCSEYSQPHEYAKLIGAPPGYIGHNEGSVLGDSMRKKQKTVVLFDEIEKAHRKVHNLLLQILDEGRLTDSRGLSIDFRQSVIVLTSNLGATNLDDIENAIGFNKNNCSRDTAKKETIRDFEKKFPPEFINRIDEIVVFKDLTHEDKYNIALKMLKEVNERTEKIGFNIDFSDSVIYFIISQQDNEKYGARPIRRAISRWIENPLSEKILRNEINERIVKITVRNGELKFK